MRCLRIPCRVIGYSRASWVAVLGLVSASFTSRFRRIGSESAAKISCWCSWVRSLTIAFQPRQDPAEPWAIESTRCCRNSSGSTSEPAWIGKTLAFTMRLHVLQHHTEAEGVLFHGAPAHFLRHQLITGVGNDQTRA